MAPSNERPTPSGGQMLSEQVHGLLREAILRGDYTPGAALKPQELAREHGVSLAVVREALVQVVGEGLADRRSNRGFAVPDITDRRWQEIAETRRVFEPATLRLAIERGDLEWEARVRAAQHRLARTPAGEPGAVAPAWSHAHGAFHRALLEGCGNAVLLDVFDRMWTATELARRWAGPRTFDLDHAAEHRSLEEAALARDADTAAEILARHVGITASALTSDT